MSDVSSSSTEILSSPSSSLVSEQSDGTGVEDSQQSDGDHVEVSAPAQDLVFPDDVESVPGSGSVMYQGYPYAWYFGTNRRCYRCSAYRRTKCHAKLVVSQVGAAVQGAHKPDCVPELVQPPTGSPTTFVTWKQQMLLATDQIGIDDVTLTPSQVWQIIRDRFYSDDNIIARGATKKQILGRLYRTRVNHFRREIYGRLETEPFIMDGSGLRFFQFHFTYYEDDILHRVIGWAHPQLLDRLKQRRCSLFIDATYQCVPVRFYQLVIIMLYDPISELYLPTWYVLTSGKTSQIYEHIWHYVFVAPNKKLYPAHIVCDFEFAMIKSIQGQFPESRIVGCLFHFKQALRRKMLKLKISDDEVSVAMRAGCIDLLTEIPRCDIVFRGIPRVRSTIKRDSGDQGIHYSKDNWKSFWKNFKSTWIKRFKLEWWNVNGLDDDIVNRTNNPLERYNRTLNEVFGNAHPDAIRFISAIEEQSRENVRLIADIANLRASAPVHADPQPAPRFQTITDIGSDSELGDDSSDSDGSDSDSASMDSMSPEY